MPWQNTSLCNVKIGATCIKYSLRNQRFSVDVTTMQLPSTFISSAVTRLHISTILSSPAYNTYMNITMRGIKAPRHESEGPGIDSPWCHWGFFPWPPPPTKPCALGSSQRLKWVPGISPGVKAAGAYGWRPTTLVVPNVKKIRGLKLPGTPWATSAFCGMTRILQYCDIIYKLFKSKFIRWVPSTFYSLLPITVQHIWIIVVVWNFVFCSLQQFSFSH